MMNELNGQMVPNGNHNLISGQIGPRGDGYGSLKTMSSDEAKNYHYPQIEAFAAARLDAVTALTLNYLEEAVEFISAASDCNLPVVISFTVETDGRLPGGEALSSTIEQVDANTDSYASHYTVKRAHTQHVRNELENAGEWKNRKRGIRANTSTKSHEELDNSDALDSGDICALAEEYRELNRLLPKLAVAGGCFGTDHTHLEAICDAVLTH